MATSSQGTGEYDLGIDLGTSWTAAAVREVGEAEARAVPLEARAVRAPSVVLVEADGTLLVGSAAEDAGARAPERVVHGVKRRLRDDTPVVVAGAGYSADRLAAGLVRRAADRVAHDRDRLPRRLAVAHPAGWGARRRGVFSEALAEVGLLGVVLLPEPEAAATASADRIPEGHTAAVYDLGGGTFDAAVVRGTGAGRVSVLGRGKGLEAFGGADVDEALFQLVRDRVGGAVAGSAAAADIAALRRACVAAKEALSTETETVVEVELPGTRTRVRVTRAELEERISPALGRTVEVLQEVLDTAGVAAADLDSVLLVGGSARIPLVADLLGRALGRPVAVDTGDDAATAVARGAAIAAGGSCPVVAPAPAAPAQRPGPAPAVAPNAVAPPLPAMTSTAATTTATPAPAPTGAPAAPPPAEHDTDDDRATTVRTGLPVSPAPATAATAPATPTRATPVSAARAPGAHAASAAPRRRRRMLVGAVAGGVLVAAGGVLAATVPMVDASPTDRSETVPLPAPAAVPVVAPPPAPAAPITADVSTRPGERADPPASRSAGRTASRAPAAPAPRAGAPRPAVPRAVPARPLPAVPPAARPAPVTREAPATRPTTRPPVTSSPATPAPRPGDAPRR